MTSTAAEAAPPEVRARLALALDVDDLVAAAPPRPASCARGSGWPRWASSSTARPGPTSSPRWPSSAIDVFGDLKLHDIPTTVGKAARVLGALGAATSPSTPTAAWRCSAPASTGS